MSSLHTHPPTPTRLLIFHLSLCNFPDVFAEDLKIREQVSQLCSLYSWPLVDRACGIHSSVAPLVHTEGYHGSALNIFLLYLLWGFCLRWLSLCCIMYYITYILQSIYFTWPFSRIIYFLVRSWLCVLLLKVSKKSFCNLTFPL